MEYDNNFICQSYVMTVAVVAVVVALVFLFGLAMVANVVVVV